MKPQTEFELKFISPLLPVSNEGKSFTSIPSEISHALLGEQATIGLLTANLPAGLNYEITIRIQAIEE